MTDAKEFALRFTQIAETDHHRSILSGVEPDHHRYPYETLFRGAFSDVSVGRRVWQIVRRTIRSDADLVVLCGYERVDCWLQLLILKLRRRKVALFLDSTVSDRRQHFVRGLLKRLFIRSLGGVFAYGLRSKEYAVGLGARPENVFIPCFAAALQPGFSPSAALTARCQADGSALAPRFLYVGRLVPEKGLDILIEAFATVRGAYPQATLAIVGDGALRPQLQDKVHDLMLPARSVQFLGTRVGAALSAEYGRATALVLPSRSEPWGLVVNEALAHGCPVIVSDCCGCLPELVLSGETGFQHRSGDAGDLAEKLALAPMRFADRESVGRRCQDVVGRYTPENAAYEILKGCRQMLAGVPREGSDWAEKGAALH